MLVLLVLLTVLPALPLVGHPTQHHDVARRLASPFSLGMRRDLRPADPASAIRVRTRLVTRDDCVRQPCHVGRRSCRGRHTAGLGRRCWCSSSLHSCSFALIGIQTRRWWVAAVLLTTAAAVFLPLWIQYATVLLNARGPSATLLYLRWAMRRLCSSRSCVAHANQAGRKGVQAVGAGVDWDREAEAVRLNG